MRSWKSISGIVFYMLLFSFLADTFNFFFIRFIYPNSFIIGNTWYILNYFITILLFLKILDQYKKAIFTLLAIFLFGCVLSFLFLFDFTESNVFVRLFSNVSFIFLSLLIYFNLLKKPNLQLRLNPVFWIATSLFIYNSLILLQGIFNNYLIFDLKISGEAYTWISIIKLFANSCKNFILFYVLILISKGYQDSLNPRQIS
ncbi:MAG: hypothetical protein ABJO91_06080 [Ekhidna sp.]